MNKHRCVRDSLMILQEEVKIDLKAKKATAQYKYYNGQYNGRTIHFTFRNNMK
jgi:hypothetical protein